jgi:hypothetical protein
MRSCNVNPNSLGTNDGKCKKGKKGWKNNRISYIVSRIAKSVESVIKESVKSVVKKSVDEIYTY